MADSALQAVRNGSVWSATEHQTYRKHSGEVGGVMGVQEALRCGGWGNGCG